MKEAPIKTLVKNKPYVLLIFLTISLLIFAYAGGLLTQVFGITSVVDPWSTESLSMTYNPFLVIIFFFKGPFKIIALGIFFAYALFVAALIVFAKAPSTKKDSRNFNYSESGVYGTASWLTEEEFDGLLLKKPLEENNGIILGTLDDIPVSVDPKANINKHIACYGASGSGKSHTFGKNYISQCIKNGESFIVTDPKGEMYSLFAQYAKDQGYNVKVLNVVNFENSDGWSCLNEIIKDPEDFEVNAQLFAKVAIQNTSGAKSDVFFDSAAQNLLHACILYVLTMYEKDPSVKPTIGSAFDMISKLDQATVTAKFNALPDGHVAKGPWNIFQKASEKLGGNIFVGVGTRFQMFMVDKIRNVTSYNEIDLELPGREKCAYFAVIPDQHSAFNLIPALFFSFLFIKLVKYADTKTENKKCKIPVHFLLDEFPNIGAIPEFEKKISTVRSRDLRIVVIFQNIAQLQNRYPNGVWSEIIGNCDTQLFLGCTDPDTAKFIADRTGVATVEVESRSDGGKDALGVSKEKVSHGVGKRTMLTPDEVLRLDNNEAIVIMRAKNALRLKKYPFHLQPVSESLVEVKTLDHVPEWKKLEASGIINPDNESSFYVSPRVQDDFDKFELKLELEPGPLTTETRSNFSMKKHSGFSMEKK